MKTLAIRLEDEEHELLVLIARVDGLTLADELRQAVQSHVSDKRAAPDFTERAQAILAEIDQEAATRRSAIQSLFGEPKGASEPEASEGQPSRRGNGPKGRKQ